MAVPSGSRWRVRTRKNDARLSSRKWNKSAILQELDNILASSAVSQTAAAASNSSSPTWSNIGLTGTTNC